MMRYVLGLVKRGQSYLGIDCRRSDHELMFDDDFDVYANGYFGQDDDNHVLTAKVKDVWLATVEIKTVIGI